MSDSDIRESRENTIEVLAQLVMDLNMEIKNLIYKYSVAEAGRQMAESRLRAFEVDFKTKDI